MANCDCNTSKDLTDNCGEECKQTTCSENTDLVSLTIIKKSYETQLTAFENVFNEFQSLMTELCADENLRFEIIKNNVTLLVRNEEDCCETINSKLEEIGDLIELINVGQTRL